MVRHYQVRRPPWPQLWAMRRYLRSKFAVDIHSPPADESHCFALLSWYLAKLSAQSVTKILRFLGRLAWNFHAHIHAPQWMKAFRFCTFLQWHPQSMSSFLLSYHCTLHYIFFIMYVRAPKRMNPNVCGDPLTFQMQARLKGWQLVCSFGPALWSSLKYLSDYWLDSHEMFKDIQGPQRTNHNDVCDRFIISGHNLNLSLVHI